MTGTSGCAAGGVLKVIDGALVCVSQMTPCPAVPADHSVLYVFLGVVLGALITLGVYLLVGDEK